MNNGYIEREHAVLLKNLMIREWSAVASLAIVVYEHVITCKDELHYIWRRPFSGVRCAYVFSRYFTLITQSVNLGLVFGPLSSIELGEHICRRWFLFQLLTASTTLGALDFIIMLEVFALYRKDKTIGSMLMLCSLSMLAVLVAFGPRAMHDIPYDPICNALDSPPAFMYFGVVVWLTHILLGLLTAAKWKLTALGVPVARLVSRDGAWALSVICLLFAYMIPHSMTMKGMKPEIVFTLPITVFSISCCRIIINMQAFAHLQQDEEIIGSLTLPSDDADYEP